MIILKGRKTFQAAATLYKVERRSDFGAELKINRVFPLLLRHFPLHSRPRVRRARDNGAGRVTLGRVFRRGSAVGKIAESRWK
jgi:hypothetical protein